MISKKHLDQIKKCFSGQELNINKIRTDLGIKRGNNTLRDFIIGESDDPGVMALEKMADYANMDFIMIPVKRLDRLDSISRQQEEKFIELINSRFDEFCLIMSDLTKASPKKVGIKKEPKFKRNIDLSKSNVVMESLGTSNQGDEDLDSIFSDDMKIVSVKDIVL